MQKKINSLVHYAKGTQFKLQKKILRFQSLFNPSLRFSFKFSLSVLFYIKIKLYLGTKTVLLHFKQPNLSRLTITYF